MAVPTAKEVALAMANEGATQVAEGATLEVVAAQAEVSAVPAVDATRSRSL